MLPNETMSIDKFQMLKLTFHWSPINIFKQVFSESTRPIELEFQMKIPYDRSAKIHTNCSGHMTKMAAMHI